TRIDRGGLGERAALGRAAVAVAVRAIAAHPTLRGATVHPVAKLLTRSKQEAPLGFDRDDLARLRIATLVPVVTLHVKGPKAADLDVLAAAKSLLHRLENRLDGGLCLLLRQPALRHQHIDQVRLEHRALSWVRETLAKSP